MSTKLSHLESTLISLLIFFIPTNLSLHFLTSHAFVHGIIVDYLIPKVYISDIIVISLLLIWFFKSHRFLIKHFTRFFIKPLNFIFASNSLLLTTLYLLLILSSLLSQKPIPSIWSLLKLLEMSILTLYLSFHLKVTKTTRARANFARHLKPTLIATTTFQSLIAIFQWLQKKSVLGYLFLGETTLKTSSQIAKTALTGELRPLPYGTTPHPNVLAGFLAISLSLLLIINKLYPSKSNRLTFQGVTFKGAFWLLALTTLILTQSLSAIATFLLGTILIYHSPKQIDSALSPLSKLKHRLLALVVAFSLSTILLFYFSTSTFPASTSITRRLRLNSIAIQMIKQSPTLGVGPGLFTAHITDYGEIPGPTRFLQPVHNIYLLFISETGLLTTALLTWIFIKNKHRFLKTDNRLLIIPIIQLATIGLLDHYPLTLQTGQLLLSLSIALSLVPHSNLNAKSA